MYSVPSVICTCAVHSNRSDLESLSERPDLRESDADEASSRICLYGSLSPLDIAA